MHYQPFLQLQLKRHHSGSAGSAVVLTRACVQLFSAKRSNLQLQLAYGNFTEEQLHR
jgi:hypothetical protein